MISRDISFTQDEAVNIALDAAEAALEKERKEERDVHHAIKPETREHQDEGEMQEALYGQADCPNLGANPPKSILRIALASLSMTASRKALFRSVSSARTLIRARCALCARCSLFGGAMTPLCHSVIAARVIAEAI